MGTNRTHIQRLMQTTLLFTSEEEIDAARWSILTQKDQCFIKLLQEIKRNTVEVIDFTNSNDLLKIRLTRVDVDLLCKAFETNTSVKVLILDGQTLGDRGIRKIAQLLHSEPSNDRTPESPPPSSIELLNLNGNEITDEGLIELFNALQHHQRLRELHLLFNPFTADGIHVLFSMLPLQPHLKVLRLGPLTLAPKTIPLLVEYLNSNPSLEQLDLIECSMTDEGLLALGKALEQNTRLRHLDLTSLDGVSSKTLVSFFNSLSLNQGLQALIFYCHPLDSESCLAFSEMLNKKENISALEIGVNQMKTEDFKSIVKALKHSSKLGKLILYDVNNQGDTTLSDLAELLKTSQSLKELTFYGNFSPKGLLILADVLQHVTQLNQLTLTQKNPTAFELSSEELFHVLKKIIQNLECNFSIQSFYPYCPRWDSPLLNELSTQLELTVARNQMIAKAPSRLVREMVIEESALVWAFQEIEKAKESSTNSSTNKETYKEELDSSTNDDLPPPRFTETGTDHRGSLFFLCTKIAAKNQLITRNFDGMGPCHSKKMPTLPKDVFERAQAISDRLPSVDHLPPIFKPGR